MTKLYIEKIEAISLDLFNLNADITLKEINRNAIKRDKLALATKMNK